MGTRVHSNLPGTISRRGRLRAITCALLVACAGSSLRADPDPPKSESMEMMAAHAAARIALVDLRVTGGPGPRDYKVAEELLAVASRLTDASASAVDQSQKNAGVADQQTIYRLYLEAATGADDVAAIRRIIARLYQIDPSDTVSQLRLISAKIADYQTADDRLAAYARFLGPDGDIFDPSVRSRLALDAALLLRERGDMEGFVERLDQALDLDKTNKDAALLALTFYSQRLADPLALFEWRLCVLGADPFDVSVYSAIVDGLLAEGAYTGAFHFAQLHRRLCDALGRAPGDAAELAYDLAEWNTAGPDAVIRRLSELVERARQQAAERRKQAQDRGQPLDGFPTPEEIRLPFSEERVRVICAAALHDQERAAIFLGELAETVRIRSERALDPAGRPAGVSEEDAKAAVRSAKVELAWLRLLAGVQPAEAVKGAKDLIAAGDLDAATTTRLEGWIALRSGDTDRADSLLRAAAPTDSLAALGLEFLSEMQNDQATAIVRARDIAWRFPGTEAAACAATRYYALTPRERPHPSDVAQQLEANAAAVPKWLDMIVDNPRRIMTLEVAPVRTTQDIQPLERTPVRITVRNTSPIPLAVGPDSPINSRLLFGPSIDVGTGRLPANELAHVASVDRRIRLLPNEAVDIVTFPDIGLFSHVAELGLSRPARVRWRILQGFQLVETKRYDAGPLCLSAELPTMTRKLPNRAESVFTALQTALQSGGPREIADVILSMKYQIAFGGGILGMSEVDKLVEVIAGKFARLERPSKILILCLMPTQANLGQVIRIDQVVAQETDEDVLAVALATRVVRPDDPLLTAPGVLKSPNLAALAQIVQDRLAAGVKTYATAGMQAPDLAGTIAATPQAEPPKPLNLENQPKPDSAQGTEMPPAKPVALPAVDPPDTTPVPVLP